MRHLLAFLLILLPLPSRDLDRQNKAFVEDPEKPDPRAATIRFDRADVFWLRAYAQVLSGVGEFVLAFDPSSEIAKLLTTRRAIAEQYGDITVRVAQRGAKQLELMLRQSPDGRRTDALLARIADFVMGSAGPFMISRN